MTKHSYETGHCCYSSKVLVGMTPTVYTDTINPVCELISALKTIKFKR